MAQDFDRIIKILKDIQMSNDNGSQTFERLLNSISLKLEQANFATSDNVIKTYVNELANSLDDKYSSTIHRFEDIEKALKAIYNTGNATVTKSDLKELFDSYSANINDFRLEIKKEKAIISGLENKISELINNKSDKDDIVRTISLLRKDFENLNVTYKTIVEDINVNLKSIVSGIVRLDPLKNNDVVREQVNTLYHAGNEILNVLRSVDARNAQLSKIVEGLSSEEELKKVSSIIETIIDKTTSLQEKIETLSDKDDVKNLTSIIKDKTEFIATKENVSKIKDKAEDILSSTDELKQALASVAQNVDNISKDNVIKDNLKDLYSKLNELDHNIEEVNVKGEIFDIIETLNSFKDEILTVKNITKDLLEVLEDKIVEAIDKYSFDAKISDAKNDIINELKQLPSKDFINTLLNSQGDIIGNLFGKTEIITNKLTELELKNTDLIKQSTQDLSDKIDATLNKLENTASIKDYELLKEHCASIAVEIKNLAKQIETVTLQNSEVDNANVVNEIKNLAKNLENISSKDDIAIIQQNNSKILKDIEQILQDEYSHQAFDEITKTTKNIADSVSDVNFNSQFSKIYDKTNFIENWLINSRIKENSQDTLEYINKKPNQAEILAIYKNTEQILKLLEVITSKFENNELVASGSLQEEINDIKNVLIEYLTNYKTDLYEQYIDGVRQIINNSNGESRLNVLLDRLENTFSDMAAFNSRLENDTLNTLDEISIVNSLDDNEKNEFVSLSKQIEKLSMLINGQDANSNIEKFISEKLQDISNDLSSLSEGTETRILQNLSYQTELIENKADMLSNFIKELSSTEQVTENQDLSDKLELLSAKLPDLKQELEFVSTDIVENINAKIQQCLEEISPIRATLKNLSDNKIYEDLSQQLSELQISLENNDKIFSDLTDIKRLYFALTKDISDSENNIKDFILGDTDAILIKLDNLKGLVEQLLEEGVTPLPVSNSEIYDYKADFENFKLENKICIETVANSIKDKIQDAQNELKSILSVANNNDKIIATIESLQSYIKETVYDKDLINAETSALKEKFEQFSDTLLELSDKNDKIQFVIDRISDRLDTFINDSQQKTELNTIEPDETQNVLMPDSIYSGFDMMKALDILKIDLKELKSSIETKILEFEEKFSIEATNDVSKENSLLEEINLRAEDILKSLKDDYLENIKKYLNSFAIDEKFDLVNKKLDIIVSSSKEQNNHQELNKKFDVINTKIDILAQNDINELLEDISDSLNDDIYKKIQAINSKLDILASEDNNEVLDDISYTVADISDSMQTVGKLYESDIQITSMLEDLTTKIDEADFEEIKELIISQRSYITELSPNERIDAFKKCLDELSVKVSELSPNTDQENIKISLKEMKESIMAAVVTIFDQVSFIEESEDIKDFVEERTDEINQNIATITKQLQQISNINNFDDYTYSMQDIETDLAKLRLALKDIKDEKISLQEDEFAKIKDKLHQITYSVDSLTQDEIKDLKSEISDLKEQTQFLIASSDKSFNALYSGDVGDVLNGKLTTKVDKVTKLLEKASNSDSVVRQSLIYMGEWIDSASESLNRISSKSEQIEKITSSLDNLNTAHSEQLNKIRDEFSKFENIEEKLEEQNTRISNLEVALDKVISAVENIDDLELTRKIDKIEKQLSKLSINIEKLASYVD